MGPAISETLPVTPVLPEFASASCCACVALTVSTLAAPLSCGLVPAATRFVGAPLAFSAG